MKLSECWIGRVVQNKDKTYDETIEEKECGVIEQLILDNTGKVLVEVKLVSGMVEYKYYTPEDIKPLED
tara:strand:- start:652 stop:858 length:207 start_codon:yes stop_codon:yes gene_type:complete